MQTVMKIQARCGLVTMVAISALASGNQCGNIMRAAVEIKWQVGMANCIALS
jgi:hypothetical protein